MSAKADLSTTSQEVSCVTLGVFFRFLDHVGRDANTLAEGLAYNEEHLRDQHASIDWLVFREICQRFRRMFPGDPEICYRAGVKVWELESFGFQHIMGPLLATSPAFLYSICPRMLRQQFSMIELSYERTASKSCRLQYTFGDGYEPFPEFVDVVRGMMCSLPTSAGAPLAEATVAVGERGFALDIAWPRHPNVFRRLFNTTFGRLRSLRRAVTELERGHTLLEQRLAESRELSLRLDALLALGKSVERGLDVGKLVDGFSSVLDEMVGLRVSHVRLDDGQRLGEERWAALLPPDSDAVGASEGPFVPLPVAEDEASCADEAVASPDGAWAYRIEGQESPIGWLALTGPRATFAVADQSLLLDGLSRLTHALQNVVAFQALQEHRRSLEQKVETRTAELAAHAQRLQATNEKLLQIDQAKRRFFSHLTHELKNPMALLHSTIEALGRGVEAGETSQGSQVGSSLDELVQIGRQNAARVTVAVDDLMDLALLEESKLQLRPGPVDLVRLCSSIVSESAPWGAELDVSLELQTSTPKLWVTADARLLNKLVLNLVGNAVKFSPKGSSVVVQIEVEGAEVRVQVLDRGPGIPAKERERIFEPFEQTEEGLTPRSGRGAGLGLNIAREVARLHGGDLSVAERPGGGSVFELRAPIVAEDWTALEEEAAAATTTAHEGEAASPEGGAAVARPGSPAAEQVLAAQLSGVGRRKPVRQRLPDFSVPVTVSGEAATCQWPRRSRPRILLVDDEVDILRTEGGLLQEEFDVDVAENGMDALEIIASVVPDAIVTDVAMPGMSGLQLCQRVREDRRTEHVPVLLLTAFGQLSDKLRGFALGADDYVPKPFHHAELVARIRTQIRLRQLTTEVAASSNAVVVGTMAAGIAHEMKNPLNVLLNAVEPLRWELQEEEGDGGRKGMLLDLIRDSGARLSTVAESFSRLVAATDGPVVLDLREHLLDLVTSRRNRLQGRIEPQVCCECGEPVPVPREQLSLVVGNFLDNAIDALLEAKDGREPALAIRCSRDDAELKVEVEDNGIGMDLALLESSADLFTTSKEPGKGTGVGLAIVRQILVALDGRLQISSTPDKGTTATAWIPLTAGTEPLEAQ